MYATDSTDGREHARRECNVTQNYGPADLLLTKLLQCGRPAQGRFLVTCLIATWEIEYDRVLNHLANRSS